MRRYLTDCAPAPPPGQVASQLTLRGKYTASVTLTGQVLSLHFAVLPAQVLVNMARVFVGPTGDAASVSDAQPNALKTAPDGRLLVDDVTSTNCNTDFSLIYQLAK